MNRNTILIPTFVALAGILAFGVIAPAFAATLQNHVNNAIVVAKEDSARAVIQSHQPIAKDGSQGAYGFGLITNTDSPAAGVIVATTHGGIKDSEDQVDAADARWHTHYVQLGQGLSGLCGDNLEVKDITFEAPGDLGVNGKVMTFKNMPAEFTGHSALTGNELVVNPGTNVANVVAFALEPQFGEDGSLKAVCVVEVTPSDHLTLASVVR